MSYVGGADKQTNAALLEQQRSQLVTHEQSLAQAGEEIRSELVSLEAVWQGNAAQEFMTAANTWQQGFKQVLDGFSLLNRNVGVANEGFTQAEQGRASQSTGGWTTT
jgi:WXG100 family type VII secretion target